MGKKTMKDIAVLIVTIGFVALLIQYFFSKEK